MMERLTRKDKCKLSHGEEIIICNHDKQDCNDSCMRIKPCKWYKKVQEKLWEYENAEEQGLLLRLPCPIGTTVYNTTWWDDVTEKVKVDGKTFYRTVHKHKVSKSKFSPIDIYNFGKTVFLTQEQAEQKLKEMESE